MPNFADLGKYLKREDVPLVTKINTLLQSSLSHENFLGLAKELRSFMPKDEMGLTTQERLWVKKLMGAVSYRRAQQRISR